ncbi:MAG TPA: AIPR family protein [Trebonia sp.]|jgi:hypothetical protein|nr:AIPR family protein [Trebonia sp.]
MAAHLAAGVPDLEAARRVTDYYNDDGIDGFAVTKSASGPPTIYLVQAKWSAKGTYNFKERDVSVLFEGLTKLRREGGPHGKGLHQENPLRDHLGDLLPVVHTIGVRFVLVWATSGQNKPSPSIVSMVTDKIADFTRDEINVDYGFLLLEDFIRVLEAEVAPAGVTVSGGLLSTRKWEERHESLQGIISAMHLAKWYREHGRRLFDDNVRVEMDSEVNKEIVRCVLEEPQNFWYFNNGITALCETWEKSGADVEEVSFRFDGLRIVNGAQTVSSISRAMTEPDKVERAQVPIRFIKLRSLGPEFGARITYATNRSNPMQPRDLLAIDHVQQRLRDELKLTWGLTYAIRANEDLPAAAAGCSVLEAVIAMASGRHDIRTLVAAKGDIESLWPSDRELYGNLFGGSTSVIEVWRRVRALRLIKAELGGESVCTTQREKAVAVLGDLIVAHIVFRRLGDEGVGDFDSKWDDRLREVPQFTREALHALVQKVNAALPPKSRSGNGFRLVSARLQNQEWLAEQVRLILANDGPVPPGPEDVSTTPWSPTPEFWLDVKNSPRARGRRCDGGFLVYVGSSAAAREWGSLTTPQIRHRRNLRDSLGLVPEHGYLRLTRDALFASPSQAGDVLQGHSVNGADEWVAADGKSYNQVLVDEATSR